MFFEKKTVYTNIMQVEKGNNPQKEKTPNNRFASHIKSPCTFI